MKLTMKMTMTQVNDEYDVKDEGDDNSDDLQQFNHGKIDHI